MTRITGTPSKALTVFIGRTSGCPGIWEMVSAIIISDAPNRAVAGNSTLWSALRKIILAIWGTAIPMNPMGPQNAVTLPANSVVAMSILLRV